MTDIIGKRCGLLQVISKAERPKDYEGQIKGTWWRCRCNCGREVVIPRQYITAKTKQSCGCLKRGAGYELVKPKKTAAEIAEDKARAGRARAEQMRGKVKNFRMPSERERISAEDRKMLDGISRKCKCAWCGKVFERLSKEWTYKDMGPAGRMRWYCSYTCWRAVDREKKPHGNSKIMRGGG